MTSKPSTNTTTSTAAEQDPMPSQQSTAHSKKESSVAVTSSTPNPVSTSVVQRYVTDAAEIISATSAYRKMFIAEVFRKCNENAQWEKKFGKTSPELPKSPPVSRRLPAYAVYPNYSDGMSFSSQTSQTSKFIPAGENKVIDRLVENYSIPKTSTSPSGSTSTITTSSAAIDSSTTATAKPAEAEAKLSTPQDDSNNKTTSDNPGYKNQHQC